MAYVYLPVTAFGGHTNFTRYFFSQVDKQAVIVDQRFNRGGQLATDIVEFLSRKLMSSVAMRDGGDEVEPPGGIFGPKVMIGEFAGSGGEALPWYFQLAGDGKLIGKCTWGGLVGRVGAPQLMDRGFASAPSSAVWDPAESAIAERYCWISIGIRRGSWFGHSRRGIRPCASEIFEHYGEEVALSGQRTAQNLKLPGATLGAWGSNSSGLRF